MKINGELHYLWRAVDHDGEEREFVVTKTREEAVTLAFIKKAMKRHSQARMITTEGLGSYKAARKDIGNAAKHEIGCWTNIGPRTPTILSDNESARC